MCPVWEPGDCGRRLLRGLRDRRMTDPEVIRITSKHQIGKTDDGAVLITRSRDSADPREVCFEFGSADIAVDFAINALAALRDYIRTELDIVL